MVTSFADIFFLSVDSFHFGRTLSPRGQFLLYIWNHIQYVGQHIHCTCDIRATNLCHHTHSLYDITPAISMESFALYKTSHPHFMTSKHHFYDITHTISVSSHPLYWWYHTNCIYEISSNIYHDIISIVYNITFTIFVTSQPQYLCLHTHTFDDITFFVCMTPLPLYV